MYAIITFNELSIVSKRPLSTHHTLLQKIVLVATSCAQLGDHPTGLWIEELASAYYTFLAAEYDITIASPKGGPIPIDAGSLAEAFFTDSSKKFMHDATAIGHLCHSTPLSDIDFENGGYDAIFMAGGHGTVSDFINCPSLKKAIETMYAANKVVASVCHGPICLTDCVKADGKPLVEGMTVTGFSNTEEEAVQLTSVVPFLLETKFKELGAKYERGDDWSSKVCVDGNLITGQNPQSTEECAAAVVKVLK